MTKRHQRLKIAPNGVSEPLLSISPSRIPFINRAAERNLCEVVLSSLPDAGPTRCVYIQGIARIGKSRLLREIGCWSAGTGRRWALIDLQEVSSLVEIALQCREQFGAHRDSRQAFRRFDKLQKQWLRSVSASQATMDTETPLQGAWHVTPSALLGAASGALAVAAGGPLGPEAGIAATWFGSALGEALFARFRKRGSVRPSVPVRDGASHSIFGTDLEKRLMDSFVLGVENMRAVLLFDSLEQISDESPVVRWMGLALSSGLDRGTPLFCVASQAPPPTHWKTTYPVLRELRLQPLPKSYAIEMIHAVGVLEKESVRAIEEASARIPGRILTLCADVSATGEVGTIDQAIFEDRSRYLATVVRGLKSAVSPELVRYVLEAASVLRAFNEELVEDVAQAVETELVLQSLEARGLLDVLADRRFIVQNFLRILILDNLRERYPERYHEIHNTAASVYEGRCLAMKPWSPEWMAYSREHLYHKLQADPDAGLLLVIGLLDLAWAYRRIEYMRSILDDLSNQHLTSDASEWFNYYRLSLDLKWYGADTVYAGIDELANKVDLPKDLKVRARLLQAEVRGERDGRWDLARESALEGLSFLHGELDAVLTSLCYEMAGRASLALNQPDLAEDLLKRELDISREAGDRRQEARALSFIGVAYRLRAAYDSALEALSEAEPILRELQDDYDLGLLYGNIGDVHRELGEMAPAESFYSASQRRAKVAAEPMLMALSEFRLTDIERIKGHYRKAEEGYRSSLKLIQN
jgi:hypothetical protein